MNAPIPDSDLSRLTECSWTTELDKILREFAVSFEQYKCSMRAVRAHAPRAGGGHDVNILEAIQEIFHLWVDGKCQEATRNSGSKGHVKIDRLKLPSKLGVLNLNGNQTMVNGSYVSSHQAPADLVVKDTIDLANISQLQVAITEAASQLEIVAYKDAGLTLGNEFGLSSAVDWRREIPLKVKRQKGLFLLARKIYGTDTYERRKSISKLEMIAKTFEAETGLCGLSELFRMCRETDESITQNTSDSRVPSRTRVETKAGVVAVFYNDKMVIHLTEALFEALVGFVREYAPSEYLCKLELV